MPRIGILLQFALLAGLFCGYRPVTASETEASPSYLLRYHYEPGEFVRYEVSDHSSVTTRKGQVQETVRNQSDFWRHYRVVSVDSNGEAVLELMIDRVRLMVQFDDAPPTLFDSADPNQQPDKFKSILSSVGHPMNRMRVDARGEMLSIQNLQGGAAPTMDPALNFLLIFPEEPVTIGETWKQTIEVEVPVTARLKEKMKLLRTYRLESVENQIAKISVSTALAKPVRDPAVQTRLLQQTPSGTIEFDLESRQLVSRLLKVQETVVGAFGAETMVEARGTRSEKRVTDEPLPEKTADGQLSRTK